MTDSGRSPSKLRHGRRGSALGIGSLTTFSGQMSGKSGRAQIVSIAQDGPAARESLRSPVSRVTCSASARAT